MKRAAVALCLLAACDASRPEERYGFVALLGRDTVSVESVTRRGNKLMSDEVDRFPRVRQRHTEIELADDGSIKRLVMDIHTPGEPENQRDRRVEVDVSGRTVRLSKRDKAGTLNRTFDTDGGMVMAHLPQMYSLYDLYFAAALRKAKASSTPPGEPIPMRQFYIDREFDNFPLHRGVVKAMQNGKAEIRHDWLSGAGEATLDSGFRLLRYSGEKTTYKVAVSRLADPPDVRSIGARFAALETSRGGMKALSVRDTTRAVIGTTSFIVDYSRPLARGRRLLGGIIPYDQVWRTGANAATQFSTSAPINFAGIPLPAGKYTLWTVPRATGTVDLIVNSQTGQWGTGYNRSYDVGRRPLTTDSLSSHVEAFTISIQATGDRQGSLLMEWGFFRWTAPIAVP